MPWQGVGAPEAVFGGVNEWLERPVVVAAEDGVLRFGVGKGPNVTRESEAKVFGFEDERVLEDLDVVVGDEAVTESGGVESNRDQNKDDKVGRLPRPRV